MPGSPDSEGRVRVCIRPRPLTSEETKHGSCLSLTDNSITIQNNNSKAHHSTIKQFHFDSVFSTNTSQEDVYDTVAHPIISDALKGYNGTILAYGQVSPSSQLIIDWKWKDPYHGQLQQPHPWYTPGIIPRCLSQIFSSIAGDTDHSYSISVSYLQLYMEVLSDLIYPESQGIVIREDPDEGVFLQNTARISVTSLDQCIDLLESGNKNRVTAGHDLNQQSSRSHAIAIVYLEKDLEQVMTSQLFTLNCF
ncbi:hypothetical protein GEMRC1_010210 [Eukaryota sp. GEM-RC1]